MFLKETKVKFIFKGGQLDITIVDIEKFIDELRLLADSKKYNIL